jgi:undecaprenyl-diphosphatase
MILPEIIKVILLGILEGITEFLPISSTGHLIVASALLNFQNALGGTFELFIQVGAVVAVIFFYRADLAQQARAIFHHKSTQRFWINILIAFVPAAILGFLFGDVIKAVLFHPAVVAVSLIVGGIVLILIERSQPDDKANVNSIESLSSFQALGVGLAQTFALIPGVSRAGASIVGGMLIGLDRSTATRFSFYLAIPTLGIATIYDLVKSLGTLRGNDLFNLIVGAVVSGIVAWLCIRWLLAYVGKNRFSVFGYYRIVAGLLILLLLASGLIQ